MEITIIGAGAIGGVLGAYLAKGGENVILCDIVPDHVAKIRTEGIRIEGPDEQIVAKVDVYSPEELLSRNKSLDYVFVCTKAQHAQEAIEQVFPLLNKDTKVVSFQNGVVELQIPSELEVPAPMYCFVNFSADYLEPGRILYGGESSVCIGEKDGSTSNRLLDLKVRLEKWGPVVITDNILGYLWSKLSYASLLYATALVDETMANVVWQKGIRPALVELCVETIEVADHLNIKLKSFDVWQPEILYPRENQVASLTDNAFDRLAEWMSKNKKQKSGIWRDLAVRHRKTEVEYDLAPIVELGKEFNLPLPLTSFVIQRIREIERKNEVMSWENLFELQSIYEKTKLDT